MMLLLLGILLCLWFRNGDLCQISSLSPQAMMYYQARCCYRGYSLVLSGTLNLKSLNLCYFYSFMKLVLVCLKLVID